MKKYLGDGAYADFDGYSVILTTSNGIVDTNTIVLEPEVLAAFVAYVDRIGWSGKKEQVVQAALAWREADESEPIPSDVPSEKLRTLVMAIDELRGDR